MKTSRVLINTSACDIMIIAYEVMMSACDIMAIVYDISIS